VPRFRPTVELAPGADLTATPSTWSWTDLTLGRYVHEKSKISITRGRQNRYAQTAPATCGLTLLNPDGIWVPDNPVGTYYGLIDQNTPLRVLMRSNTSTASDVFNRTSSSSWDTADVGGAWTNAGGAGSDFSVSAANGGRHLHTAASSPHYSVLAVGLTRVDITARVRVNALSTGAAQTAALVCRYASSSHSSRVELQFATSGAISGRVVLRTGGVDSAGSPVASTLTHTAATWYRVRMVTGYTSVRFKVWVDGTTEPATWLVDGSTGVWLETPPISGSAGCYSMRETGNTNANATIDFDDFSLVDGPLIRFTGYVDAWPTTWADESERQSFAPITASGHLRRIGQAKNLKSALCRASTLMQWSGAPQAKGYWPMEDASQATVFASGLTAGLPMIYTDMRPAGESDVLGTDPLPLAGGEAVFSAVVQPYTAATTWAVRALFKFPDVPSVNTGVLAWTTGGTIDRWAFVITTGSTWTIQGYTNGTEVLAASFQNMIDADGGSLFDRQFYLTANATQNGGNIDYTVNLWADNTSGALGISGSYAGTIGNVTKIFHSAYPGYTAGGYTIGHVGVADDELWAYDGYLMASGFGGETSGARLARLGSEENIPVYFGEILGAGAGSTTQIMGAQRTTSLIQQFREVEATEEGLLFDGLQGQVTLLPRQQRQNHAIDLTIDHDDGQLAGGFVAVRDDALLRNDIKAQNASGSTVPAQDVDGIRRWGVYSDAITINVQDDTEVGDHANWRLNLGKTPATRYPSVTLQLHNSRNTTLIDAWLACDIGYRLNLLNLPNTYDDADLLIEGYTETIDSSFWTVVLNTSPAQPWNVFTIEGGGNLGRLDTAGSTLNAAAGSGNLHTSTFEAGVADWTPTSATFVQSATHAHSGTYGGLLTVTGSPVQAYARAFETAVTAGVLYGANVWCYSVAGYSAVQCAIDWYDSGHAYLSTSSGTSSALAAATWERRSVIGTAPVGAVYGRYGPTLTGSPATGTAMWIDDTSLATALSVATTTGPVWRDGAVDFDIGIAGERITVFRVSGTTSPQTFGVTRSVNGVGKTQASGASVSLWRPGRLAL
jgi:hypothetical protein